VVAIAVILTFVVPVDVSSQYNAVEVGSLSSGRRYKTKTLHFGGIFPMSGSWAGGKGCLPAVEMALADINERRDVLPWYRLKMHYNNSQVRFINMSEQYVKKS